MDATFLKVQARFGGERREVLSLPTGPGEQSGATLHLPEGGTESPGGEALPPAWAVLLLPGWSGPRTGPAELLVGMAACLARAGMAVLRIDFHGRGDASGAFESCDLDRMIGDACCGLELLRSRFPGVPCAVGGICSGANVALGLAALRPAQVQAVLAWSVLPFQTARGTDLERRRRWRNLKQYAAKALQPERWLRLLRGEVNLGRIREQVTGSERPGQGERNPKDSARDIERELQGWKGGALFVWGSGDEEAGLSEAHFRRLHQAGMAGTATFFRIEGANHNFYGQGWRAELERRCMEFLRDACRDRP